MSGDPTNVNLWADADVYYSTNLAAAIPANASTAFGVDWTLVGLLDGAAGMEHLRDQDKKDHFAWGGILVKTSRKNFKQTIKFSALENNAATRSLIWPGSSDTQLIVPKPAQLMIALERREGGKVHRLITANYAQLDVDGSIKDSEEDLTKIPMILTIFPTTGGVLWTRQATPTLSSIAITPLTLAVTAGTIKKLTATATYSDASTADITDSAVWVSSATSKATVLHGYVSGVAAGTSNVSCSLGGVTSTAPSVVTVS